MPKERFPRLKNLERCKAISKILIQAYNTLAIRRVEKKHKYRMSYNIVQFENRRGRDDVEKHFLMMSSLLDKEKIDPLLYLQIMGNYGRFRHTTYLPRPRQLASPKFIETFKWLARKERAKWFLDSDWREHLGNMTSLVLDRNKIASEIEVSWEFLQAPIAMGLDVGSSAIVHSNHLSPWFLAVCKPFLRMEGLEFVRSELRREIRSCMNALMRNRLLLKAAVKAYKEHSSA